MGRLITGWYKPEKFNNSLPLISLYFTDLLYISDEITSFAVGM